MERRKRSFVHKQNNWAIEKQDIVILHSVRETQLSMYCDVEQCKSSQGTIMMLHSIKATKNTTVRCVDNHAIIQDVSEITVGE